MLQGLAELKASREGKLGTVRPGPCSNGIPQSLSSRESSERSVQSLGSLIRFDDATSVHFPQILGLLTLLSGWSRHENCMGASLVSVEPMAQGHGSNIRKDLLSDSIQK